ncbi:uncharacterized protein A1O9_01653 [Exophiala aquamarina CBS 119918]|uniref:DUF1398 domain-containing protein n=1 Tax=Exophiala aquamarina CBS 119918 TaxID=1182545 RepID=A0A072Q6W1_9EURO|nr:uncharacterized protein A1O9_01653 [Exophiala aquamarina CBS 119918]KEF63675.1 hypothetical protein A1O9_01653 [Exophiala aquamarina CBS 119918]
MASTTAIQKIFAQVHSASGLAFPNTVSALLTLGVTRYHIDYTAGTATTYKAKTSGESQEVEIEQVNIPSPAMSPRTSWSKDGVVKAIRRVQAGETKYAAFAQECADSGVTGYLAFLSGKNVLYYGSEGDVHVEWFPGAGPKVD